jgi:hypothetical protein
MSHSSTILASTSLSTAGNRPGIRILNPHRVQGGQLRGTFDEELTSGVIWRGCKLFNSGGSIWVKPPDTVRIDRDGRVMLRPDGKRHYDECISFTNNARRDSWREQTLAALAIDAPDLLEYARADAPPPPPATGPAPAAPPRAPASPRPREERDRLVDDIVPF